MITKDLGATEPLDPRPVAAIRSQLLELIEAGGEPYDRDIQFNSNDKLEYGVSSVGIDIDPDDGTLLCVVGYPLNSGMVGDEEWYKIMPDGRMFYAPVAEPYSYSELDTLEAYEQAYSDWYRCVSDLHEDTKLNLAEQNSVVDGLMFNYKQLRSRFYQQSQQQKNPELSFEEQMEFDEQRRREFVDARDKERQAWMNHLIDVRAQLTQEQFEPYRRTFIALFDAFIAQASLRDDALFRLARRSEDTNEQFDLGTAESATLEQSWQLLKLLDKCQDYVVQ